MASLLNFREAFIVSSARPDRAQLIDNSITRLYAKPEHHPKTSVEGEPGVMSAIRTVMKSSGGLQESAVASSAVTASAVAQAQAQAQAKPGGTEAVSTAKTSPAATGAEPLTPISGTASGSGTGVKRSADALGASGEDGEVKKTKV